MPLKYIVCCAIGEGLQSFGVISNYAL